LSNLDSNSSLNIISKDREKVLASASSTIYLKNLPNNMIYEIRKKEKVEKKLPQGLIFFEPRLSAA